LAVTVPVDAVKVAVVAEAATVTEAGTVSAVALSERLTTVPPAGAAADSVTIQVVLALAARLPAEHCTFASVTVPPLTSEMLAFAESPLSEAVMVAVWLAVTVPADAVKDNEEVPPGSLMDEGIVSAAVLAVSATGVPSAAAPLDIVTVQVVLALDARLPASHCTLLSETGVISEIAMVWEPPPEDPVMMAV
jgi:hypothetical protein